MVVGRLVILWQQLWRRAVGYDAASACGAAKATAEAQVTVWTV